MKEVGFLLFVIFVAGCSFEDDIDDPKVSWCIDGDNQKIEIPVIHGGNSLDNDGSVTVIVKSSCLDPVSGIDPFSNPYRDEDGVNMRFCLPDWSDCGEDANAYMTIQNDKDKLALQSWHRIASGKRLVRSGEDYRVYEQVRIGQGRRKINSYFVGSGGEFVVACSGSPDYPRNCLFVGSSQVNPLVYRLKTHGKTNLDWVRVHQKVSGFLREAAVADVD